jgi:sigma-B regulation protein RsbU (phosphoserine phosphatase)
VPAALLSVSAMHSMEPDPAEMSLLRDLAHPGGGLGTVQHPARVAAELNRRFRAGENDGRYLTMILCVLDTFDGRLYLTSAGHPAPFLLRENRAVAVPDAGGFPIAVLDAVEYDEGCVQLRPGDRLCLFSDGVIEQTDRSGDEQFGAARLLRCLLDRSTAPADRLVTAIVEDLAAWAGSSTFVDDVSVLVVDWL